MPMGRAQVCQGSGFTCGGCEEWWESGWRGGSGPAHGGPWRVDSDLMETLCGRNDEIRV